jgi:hypothetical protein
MVWVRGERQSFKPINFVWEELLALNLTFSPGEKEQLSRVSIFREPSGQPRRGYFQSRGERESPLLGGIRANLIIYF